VLEINVGEEGGKILKCIGSAKPFVIFVFHTFSFSLGPNFLFVLGGKQHTGTNAGA
jgi:hypothetical protein